MSQLINTLASQHVDRTAVAREVKALLERLNPQVTVERRSDVRVAIPVLFKLTPLDDDRQPREGASFTVVGKNISRRGMSFFHEHPLTHRRAVVTAQHPEFNGFSAEVDITWCRFTKPGWYESGGRLVAVCPPGATCAPGEPAANA